MGQCYNSFNAHKKSVICLDIQGEILISSSEDGICCAWDFKQGKQIWRVVQENTDIGITCQTVWEMKQSSTRMRNISRAKREGRVAVGLQDGRVRVYDLSTG